MVKLCLIQYLNGILMTLKLIYQIKATQGITGLNCIIAHIKWMVSHLDVGLSFPLLVVWRSAHGVLIHLPPYMSWVKNDVNQFGLYLFSFRIHESTSSSLSTQGPATNCISWILQWRRSYHSFNISDYNISIPKLGHRRRYNFYEDVVAWTTCDNLHHELMNKGTKSNLSKRYLLVDKSNLVIDTWAPHYSWIYSACAHPKIPKHKYARIHHPS